MPRLIVKLPEIDGITFAELVCQRQLDKNKLYHWPGFTPPQPQNAAASVAYFVTAVNKLVSRPIEEDRRS